MSSSKARKRLRAQRRVRELQTLPLEGPIDWKQLCAELAYNRAVFDDETIKFGVPQELYPSANLGLHLDNGIKSYRIYQAKGPRDAMPPAVEDYTIVLDTQEAVDEQALADAAYDSHRQARRRVREC